MSVDTISWRGIRRAIAADSDADTATENRTVKPVNQMGRALIAALLDSSVGSSGA
jgi:hypothetical protein